MTTLAGVDNKIDNTGEGIAPLRSQACAANRLLYFADD